MIRRRYAVIFLSFLAGKNASFHQAADIWNRIQPYLWERALIKQDWIQE